jgi:hypothetical protein
MRTNWRFIYFTCIVFVLIDCTEKIEKNNERYFQDDYYSNGKLESRIWYLNGVEDSMGLWYYENGQLMEKSELENGKRIGDTYFFHPNGKLNSYTYYNIDGIATFRKKYDDQGIMVAEEGIPIFLAFDEGSFIIEKGQVFSFSVYTAIPPNTSVSVFVTKEDGENKHTSTKEYQVKAGRIPFYQLYFEEVGVHPVLVFSELYDSISRVMRRDTTYFEVVVKPES